MSLELWLTFVAASTALLLIPGPTVMLVLSYAMSRGRGVALAAAGGVALGDFIAMTASLAGLGALVLASATLFQILKWIGAIYLVWLGVTLFRAAENTGHPGAPDPGDADRHVFSHAAIVTALNPKSIVFFVAFVPQFIRPDASIPLQFSVLIATFVTLATINALAYALLADRMRGLLNQPRTQGLLSRTGGAILILMGILAASIEPGR